MKASRSVSDWTLISAYLDGELRAREKENFERNLRADPELRLALEEMSRSRMLVRSLPRKRPGRNFTLTPQMLAPKRMPILVPALSVASLVSGFIAVILMFFQFAPGLLGRPTMLAAKEVTMEVALLESEASADQNAPEIIVWGQPQVPAGEGKGGGMAETVSVQAEPFLAQPAAPAELPPPSERLIEPTPTAMMEVMQVQPTTAPAESAPAAMATSVESEGQETVIRDEESTNPILGIRPAEDAGTMTSQEISTAEEQPAPHSHAWMIILVGSLLGLAAVAGISALWLWRRQR